jgi:hypothetical protein
LRIVSLLLKSSASRWLPTNHPPGPVEQDRIGGLTGIGGSNQSGFLPSNIKQLECVAVKFGDGVGG